MHYFFLPKTEVTEHLGLGYYFGGGGLKILNNFDYHPCLPPKTLPQNS